MKGKMRRFRQLLAQEESEKILMTATNGVLSLVDADGDPYGVPLSFAFDGSHAIYFHSATSGYKLDCISHCGRCSFCVVDRDTIVPDGFTSYFRSVIVSGTISVVEDSDERLRGLNLLCDKYSPGVEREAEIARCLGRVAVLRLDIDVLTGKEAIELVSSARKN